MVFFSFSDSLGTGFWEGFSKKCHLRRFEDSCKILLKVCYFRDIKRRLKSDKVSRIVTFWNMYLGTVKTNKEL